jgi:Raf kinase inhibitor-like YbhB/YbcL family protein
VVVGIPAGTTELKEGLPRESSVPVGPGGAMARQGKNDFGNVGYGGPCPPRGTHRYVFHLAALDVEPGTLPADDRGQLERAVKEHLVAEGRLVGTYSRSR